MSAVEAITSTAIGYVVAVLTQLAVFPLFGLPATLSDSLAIGAIFTAVSVLRSYAVRRWFESRRAH
jgi:putative effector of murein hydrolase